MKSSSALPSTRRAAVTAQPNRRERRRVETQERIYRAALRIFAERGYLETTVEDITEAADVGKGTFFNYFPTKEHVLATYGEERVAAIEAALKRAHSANHSVLAVLKELATDLAGQSSQSPDLLRSIFAAHLSCAPVRAEFQNRLQRARRVLAEIFAVGQETGEIRRDRSAAELARLTHLILMGVTIAWALNPDSMLRKSSEEVWDLFFPSLCADSTRKGKLKRKVKR
ncbi:MAG TPA: TetR family transcriptional regulator [Candidatus Acidoferrales bacterium]|nr:TetR family transcriptional regulator [Candidatus Acidoferrales bacterium]